MGPIIGEDDFFDQIDRIADRGMNFDRGYRGHRALLEATRQDGIKTRTDRDPSGYTPPKGLDGPLIEYPTKLRCQSPAAVARLDLEVLPAGTSGARGTASFGRSLRARAGLREAGFQLGDSPEQNLLLLARLRRHRLDRLELLAADQVHAGQDAFELVAEPRLDLAADPGQRPHRPGGDPRHIAEKPGLAL